jgi:hypothetical protein
MRLSCAAPSSSGSTPGSDPVDLVCFGAKRKAPQGRLRLFVTAGDSNKINLLERFSRVLY